jgi:glycosyltransferase involved in cell wall biosynthesis
MPMGKTVLLLYGQQDLGPRICLEMDTLAKRDIKINAIRWVRNPEAMVLQKEWQNILGWRFIDLKMPTVTGKASVIFSLPRLYRGILQVVKGLEFDVIHVCHLFILPLALWIARRRQVPVVYDPFEFFTRDYSRHFGLISKIVKAVLDSLENAMVKRVAGVLTINSYEDSLLRRYRRFNSNAVILNNYPGYYEVSRTKTGKIPEVLVPGMTYASYVGSFNWRNGAPQILAAFDIIRKRGHQDIGLLLIGYDPSQEHYAGESWEAAKQRDYIAILPFLPYERMVECLVFTQIGLFLPQSEEKPAGNSRKMPSYMQAGLPVVISRDYPQAHIVGENDCGILVDGNDPEEIAAAIVYLAEHPAEARGMGQRGQEAIKKKYNWQREEPKFLGIYRKALGPATGRN